MSLRAHRFDFRLASFSFAALIGALASPLAHADILGIQNNASVYRINEATGTSTLLSNNPTFAANAMARNSAGVYYTAGGLGNSRLNTINPATGMLTEGPFISLNDDVRGLAFSPADVLYVTSAVASTSANLYTMDVSTGAMTLIAPVGPMQALTFSASGTLYGWSGILGLVTIDPTTGAVTDVDASVGSAQNIQTLAFSPGGVLYAGSPDLYTVSLATGELTLVAPISPLDQLRGMEFVDGGPPAPGVALAPSPLAFGNQVINTTSTSQAGTLTNVGSATLTIASIAASGDFAQTNSCGASLAPAASCVISVTFTPTALGARSGSLSVASNAATSPNLVALSGTGTSAPTGAVASLAPTSLTFGTQQIGTTSPAQLLTLQNTGDATLTIAGIVVSGDFAQTTTCGATLAPGASCAINVTFTPTVAGPRTGSVVVTSDGAGSPSTAALSGTGTDGTAAAVPLPTLSQWSLILLGVLLGAVALNQGRARTRP